jgi:hypothetical protein
MHASTTLEEPLATALRGCNNPGKQHPGGWSPSVPAHRGKRSAKLREDHDC